MTTRCLTLRTCPERTLYTYQKPGLIKNWKWKYMNSISISKTNTHMKTNPGKWLLWIQSRHQIRKCIALDFVYGILLHTKVYTGCRGSSLMKFCLLRRNLENRYLIKKIKQKILCNCILQQQEGTKPYEHNRFFS